jgi:5-methylcytosine-specific restriction endonuclease McrBC regulatory subunit McrC
MEYQSQYPQLWQYLSETQRDLILEGQFLMNEIVKNRAYQFKDYSFLIFPFAKAYEGFLKKLFRDLKFISHLDYISDHLRLGKLMSPNLVGKLGERSLYKKIKEITTKELADRVWDVWRRGRNQIFHYFPHNLKAISFLEAKSLADEFLATMAASYELLKDQQV